MNNDWLAVLDGVDDEVLLQYTQQITQQARLEQEKAKIAGIEGD